jgi:hypothetical protein
MNEVKRLRKALADISALIAQDYCEGDKEYQAVIIAKAALEFDDEEEMFLLRREGYDD